MSRGISEADTLMTLSHLRADSIRVNGFNDEGDTFTILIQGNLRSRDDYADPMGGFEISLEDMMNLITATGRVREVLVKGGEPYLQSANLGTLAGRLNEHGISTSVCSFMDEDEIRKAADFNRFISRLYSNTGFIGRNILGRHRMEESILSKERISLKDYQMSTHCQ